MPGPDDALTPPESNNRGDDPPKKSLETARLEGEGRTMWGRISDAFGRMHWPNWATRVLVWTLGGMVAIVATGAAVFFLALVVFKPTLPYDADLYALNRPPAYIFQDVKGRTIGRRGAVMGERLKLTEMPAYLPAAFLAMEDRRFYEHDGIDFRGIARALYVDITRGRLEQGGSTITQQLVKTIFLTPERTLTRKLEEMAAARELESRLTKDQILELYLNRIYLGSGAYGVDGAAHVYFGKSAKRVTLAEAAMLASLTRAPSVFSPRRDLAAAQARAARVLRAMVEVGAVKPEDAAEALAKPATVFDQTRNVARNYFFDTAAAEAQQLLPQAKGDLIIVTTMDTAMQDAARKAIATVLDKSGARSRASQAALVSMSPDGAVRAIIGGRDYTESPFNRATQAHRQPGSAFKPFVYLAAMESGLFPYTVRTDEPITIDGYSPENYSRSYSGAMTLHDALVRSINTIAVQVCVEVGPQNVVQVARRIGIVSPMQAYPSLALGSFEVVPMELTAAYATFATAGLRVTPYTVSEIRSTAGQVLFRRVAQQPTRVAAEDRTLWMNAMLFDAVQQGTGRTASVPGHEVAGKTGTTSDLKDAWFVGFSPELVTGVWVGNDDTKPMRRVTGGGLPAQIWSGYMRVALKNTPASAIPRSLPVAPLEVATDGNVLDGMPDIEWNYQSGQEAPPPPPQQRRQRRRGLLDWLFGGDDDEDSDGSQRNRERSDNSRELPPRAVQQDSGSWTRVPAYRGRRENNPPPPDAAVPPPDTPPPGE
jgi:penicillin-binding protein 1A